MPRRRHYFDLDENKTRTSKEPRKVQGQACAYITAGRWRAGAAPFCGAPVLPGSSYCGRHAPLCGVDPTSEQGEQIAAEQDAAAASLSPHLEIYAVPEPLEDEGAIEAWDLPCPIASNAEGE